jgi:creatinine amidohydrolase/Fe(II)-dependent formamide hydrolase-like protein
MITIVDTSNRFNTEPPPVVILPLACHEVHSGLSVVSNDQILMEAISYRVAEIIRYNTFLIPVWPYGTIPEQGSSTGGICLQSDTLQAVVRDIVQSLYDHHIKQVVIINNHGSCDDITALPFGNSVVKTTVRQINYEIPGLTTIWVQPFRAARNRLIKLFSEGVTTDSIETVIVEYLAAEYCLSGSRITPFDLQQIPSRAANPSGKLAFEEVALATSEYIENTLILLDRIKSDHQ